MKAGRVPIDPTDSIQATMRRMRGDHEQNRRRFRRSRELFTRKIEILDDIEPILIAFFLEHAIFDSEVISQEYLGDWQRDVQPKVYDLIFQVQFPSFPRLQNFCIQTFQEILDAKKRNFRSFAVQMICGKGYRSIKHPNAGDLAFYLRGARPLVGLMNEQGKIESNWGDEKLRAHDVFSLPREFGDEVLFRSQSDVIMERMLAIEERS